MSELNSTRTASPYSAVRSCETSLTEPPGPTATSIDGPYYPTTQNIIYATNVTKSFPLTGVRSINNFALGQGVEKSGLTTGYTNGSITSTSINHRLVPREGAGSLVHYPNCTYETWQYCPFAWGMRTNVHSDEGDSGAPVYAPNNVLPFSGTVLLGILSAGSSSAMIFAPARTAAEALDLDFWCTTSGCP
jgi:hypothetical protein